MRSALFDGNRHVVEIESYRRLVKQFQPHCRVKQSIRLMDIRGREVHERRRTTQNQAMKTLALRGSLFHFHSAIGERKISRFGGLCRLAKLQLLNRSAVDE